jgi:hypothetical protein
MCLHIMLIHQVGQVCSPPLPLYPTNGWQIECLHWFANDMMADVYGDSFVISWHLWGICHSTFLTLWDVNSLFSKSPTICTRNCKELTNFQTSVGPDRGGTKILSQFSYLVFWKKNCLPKSSNVCTLMASVVAFCSSIYNNDRTTYRWLLLT